MQDERKTIPGKAKESVIDMVRWYAICGHKVTISLSKQFEIILNEWCEKHRKKIDKWKKDPLMQAKYRENKKKFDFFPYRRDKNKK